MTTLVLGVAGGLVGNMLAPGIGGQIGFLVGSLLGNLIDPPKVEGPRRTDLKLQRSEYGSMAPFVWGKGRLAGNIIDQTDLEEHKETSGGKGGPEVTTYTYSASFIVALATAKRFNEPAIAGVLRIWADGRLIWDASSGEEMPCEIYRGTEDQQPDPTFEAIHGVGEQPAYRGLAYAVFADYMLTDFGDRIPQLEFEVFTAAGTYPWRVSTFDTAPDGFGIQCVTYEDGIVTIGAYTTTAGGHYYEHQFDLQGNESASTDYFLDTAATAVAPIFNLTVGASNSGWFVKHEFRTAFTANPFGGSVSSAAIGGGIYKNGYIYAIGGNSITQHVGIATWPATDGQISAESGTALTTIYDFGDVNNQMSLFRMGTTNRDNIYVTDFFHSPRTLNEFDLDLNLVRSWDLDAEYAIENIVNGYAFTVYEQRGTGDLIFAVDRGNVGVKEMFCFILNDDLTLTQVDGIPTDPAGGIIGSVMELGNSGYVAIADGIACLDPPAAPELLSTIVADLSSMTSLYGEGSPESDSYDVTELTDEVRWYAVANQMTVRNAIDPLRKAFFFDAVESDDQVKFRKRGTTDSVVTIDDDDLIAREYGADSGDPLITTRKREQGMPRTVTLRYIDVDMDYQVGAQSSPRLTTLSDSDVTLDLAIGFTADEALQKCWTLQVSEWIERESFEWTTTRKYAWVEPCDVVTVRGRVVRVTERTESPLGVISWKGVLHRPSLYTQAQVAGSSEGFAEQTGPAANVSTEAVLLDIPILSQADAPFGFYAAMGPNADGRWTGATLYKSVDGGSTYTAVAGSSVPSVIGVTASSDDLTGSPPYGSPTVSGTLAAYSGGDVVDESSIVVVLTDDDAELVSVNATGLANGANLCAISCGIGGSPATLQWELLQFRDATLIDTKTYVLTGFMRGRKGTSTSGHADGDQFVLLPVTNVDAPQSELNVALKYKAVTFGNTLGSTPAFEFTNTGRGAEEYFEIVTGELPIYGENPTGSPEVPNTGLVPPPTGPCDATYFLNQCGAWAVPAGGPGGSGAPTDAQYLVLESNASLSNERVVTAGYGIAFEESGGSPGTGLTIHATSVSAPVLLAEASAAFPNGRVVTAGDNIRFDESGGSPPGAIEINATGLAPADAPFYVAGPVSGLSGARVLVAGSGIQITEGGGSPATTATIATTAPRVIQFACSDEGSELSVGTRKIALRAPYAMTITEVRASLSSYTAGSPGGGGLTVDINVNGVSILSTKLTIDGSELTSTTAATPAVISSAALADDDEISVDIDAVGSGAAGLKVALIGT